MFVDQVNVTVRAGNGGHGCMSFRREKGVPKGGPDGGRGGDGGSIILLSDKNLSSLAYFRFHPITKAKKGRHGEGSNRHGKNGNDVILKVPVGTIVRERETQKILFDFVQNGQKFLLAKGGKGGRGNASFATSTRQSPKFREEGKPGEEKELTLELRLIADVGLIGFPNVGKSTLISRISAARPVIADYPFTTLVPNLGVVDVDEYRSFVVADVPGLIQGAHLGHGLGIKFLRHVQRTKILLHLLDVSPYTQRNPLQDYSTIMGELKAFDVSLTKKPQILVANKIDLLEEKRAILEDVETFARKSGLPFFAISALKREGIKDMIAGVTRELDALSARTEKS